MKKILVLLLLALFISEAHAFCTVQGFYSDSRGNRAYATAAVYCAGLRQTKNFASNYAYAVNFGSVADSCEVCAPIVSVLAVNNTNRQSGFKFKINPRGSIVQLDVTLFHYWTPFNGVIDKNKR